MATKRMILNIKEKIKVMINERNKVDVCWKVVSLIQQCSNDLEKQIVNAFEVNELKIATMKA